MIRLACSLAATTSVVAAILGSATIARAQSPAPPVPATYVGCFRDGTTPDLLAGPGRSPQNTPEQCIATCASQGYPLAGVQNGDECFCGDSFGHYGSFAGACSTPCAGDAAQSCGGSGANAIYRIQQPPAALGCYLDGPIRDLSGASQTSTTDTPAQCTSWCASQGFDYAGTQDGDQCFCGDSYGKYSALPATLCSAACSGGATESCGGSWANAVVPTGYPTALGCFKDEGARDLLGPANLADLVATPKQCAQWCAGWGYAYAGVQDGNQCFCGNSFGQYGSSVDCTTACSGDSSQTCGGPWANQVYLTGAAAYLGCFADENAPRDLSGPWQTSSTSSPEQCVAWCGSQGYEYAGVEFGDQCFCGDSYGAYGSKPTGCNETCPTGSGTCGGAWANSVYATGAPSGGQVLDVPLVPQQEPAWCWAASAQMVLDYYQYPNSTTMTQCSLVNLADGRSDCCPVDPSSTCDADGSPAFILQDLSPPVTSQSSWVNDCALVPALTWAEIVALVDGGSPVVTFFSSGDTNGCHIGGHFRVLNGYAAPGVPSSSGAGGTVTLATTDMVWVQDPDPVGMGQTELVTYADWSCAAPTANSVACPYGGHWADAWDFSY